MWRVFEDALVFGAFFALFWVFMMATLQDTVNQSWTSSFQNFLGTGNSQGDGNSKPIMQPFRPSDDLSILAPIPPKDPNIISEENSTPEKHQIDRPRSPVSMIITDEYLTGHSALVTRAITLRNSLADWGGAIRFYEPGSKDIIQDQKNWSW
ncbi:hypothetical protein AVEN_105731-1 [Araneus ventricosus]|uniref:Uncharacterized protein n=1 Tax=Araneus ventricosus TaxID=182803 RepID=A0A4Y2IDK8_ARAVE|nr:hypothetical protein AVEN_105731-1 [Araneus ventricosus]